MRFIEEVVVAEFLPTFRSMLAGELRERGLTQREVADLLGISQSAVSKYAHGDVDVTPEIAEDERVRELVDDLADGLAEGTVSRVQALAEAEVLIRQLERGDLLAQLHEAAFPPLAEHDGTVAIHDPGDVRETERVLASVRRGLGVLENAGGFAAYIPAVGANLVEALPGAEGVDQVAGVPGRLIDVKGRVTVPAEPEFGASGHVATVLLAARDAGSDARAALNFAYDEAAVATLTERGHVAAAFDSEAPIEAAVAEAVAATSDADLLYQTGAFGVEPVAYLLGEDAVATAEAVRHLVD